MSFAVADVEQLYERDPNLKREDIQRLQEWIKKEPHLADLGITEVQLIGFLQSCYYRIEFTKTTIDNYFTIKTHCADLLDALPLDVLKRNLAVGFLNFLPKKTPENYSVLLLKLLDLKVENFNCTNLIKAINMMAEVHICQNGYDAGVVAVFDMKGYSLGHLARMNLVALKKGLYHLQEALPVRLKSVHFINMVPFSDKVIGLAKPFMKAELYNMLIFHPNSIETLYEYVPQKCLPKEYGGSAPSIDVLNEICIKNFEDNFDFFKWHDAQKVDESKRRGKPTDINKIFGLEGTFKKLEID